MLISQIGKHMDIVGKALSESQANVASDPFIGYLAKTLSAVPEEMKRKCEQSILLIGNAYADDYGDTVHIAYTSS